MVQEDVVPFPFVSGSGVFVLVHYRERLMIEVSIWGSAFDEILEPDRVIKLVGNLVARQKRPKYSQKRPNQTLHGICWLS